MVRAIMSWSKSGSRPHGRRKVKIGATASLGMASQDPPMSYPSCRCSHADTVCDATLYINGISLSARRWAIAEASA
jgi:hypothetical protein